MPLPIALNTPTYLNASDFAQYCERDTALHSALELLSMNVKNPELKQQLAARLLYWPNFEALRYYQLREEAIKNAVYFEVIDESIIRLISRNVVGVISLAHASVTLKALMPGQRQIAFQSQPLSDADAAMNLLSRSTFRDGAKQTCRDLNEQVRHLSPRDPISLTIYLGRVDGFIQVCVTDEGVIVDRYDSDDCFATAAVEHIVHTVTMDLEQEINAVGLHLPPASPTPHPDGKSYQFRRLATTEKIGGEDDDEEEHRLLDVDPNEEFNLGEFVFDSPAQAKRFIDEQCEEEDVNDILANDDIVLTKVTREIYVWPQPLVNE